MSELNFKLNVLLNVSFMMYMDILYVSSYIFVKIDKFEYILIKSNEIFFSLQFEWCDFIIIILDLKKKKKGTAYILRFWRLT